jgi:hypothetical protein
MRSTVESTIQVRRSVIISLIVLPLFSGFAAFINLVGSPQFQEIRNLDVMRLIAIGACWGAAFVGLVLLIGSRFRRGQPAWADSRRLFCIQPEPQNEALKRRLTAFADIVTIPSWNLYHHITLHNRLASQARP